MAPKIDWAFLDGAASDVAPRLLGSVLERQIDGRMVRVKIVETEAYDQTDVASHSYKGRTNRTEVMFGQSGNLYVYFTYGMHFCCNVVVGPKGYGAAVLIRAVEPLNSIEYLEEIRGMKGVSVTNGPAKLCQALRIDKNLNNHDLRKDPLKLVLEKPVASDCVVQTTRIGITRGKEVKWRYYLKDNPYVSRTE